MILRDNNKQFKKNIKNYRIAYPNNIVMNNRDFLKNKSIAYNIYNKPVLISNIYSVFEVKEGFDANFILNFLKNSQVHKKLKVIGKQGVISEIDKNVFYQLTFKLPALKEQKQINVFFNNLSKLLNDIENISIEIRQLQKEKQEYYYLL
ncbi:restriction endonuclease subunit S [Paulownia witches'-broom phytoplasma]|uniref:Restriction endonuclease subunit S n=1 Tax=Paulownia witches'-broom phytoplasma TaxID=39647 RepID=A0ABX8TQI7_9MOLU|nr:restriction endonuclease subunit S [Paulownia witches'-broom phytoplasma]QYC31313.1 restriction endonuclease subunit S [Paulownia witches'-broom phytoplasma]GLH60393.1 hypothetical protein PAWBP_1310 [Paulownia witches'-broom phytoplasma]